MTLDQNYELRNTRCEQKIVDLGSIWSLKANLQIPKWLCCKVDRAKGRDNKIY